MFSVSEYSDLRAGIFKAWGLSIRWRLGAQERALTPRSRLDEPAGISLGMVASRSDRFRFARQNHVTLHELPFLNIRRP